MLRVLAAAAVLALALPALAGPFSRWTSQPLDGAAKLVAGGPGSSTLVVLRADMDPLRSFDGGKTWTPFTVQGLRPADLRIAPSDARTWYAVTTENAVVASSPRVIHRTRDGGNTWERRSEVVNRYPLAPSIGSDSNVLYLAKFDLPFCGFLCEGTSAHVLTSTDGGATWADRDPRIGAQNLVASPADARVAYVSIYRDASGSYGQGGSVQRTLDSGATWQAMRFPESPYGWTDMLFAEIALDHQDPAIAYVRPSQYSSALAEDVYVTRDGGASWTRVVQPQGRLVTDPVASGRVYLFARDGRTLESRDAGRTWVAADPGTPGEAMFPGSFLEVSGFAVAAFEGRRAALRADEAKIRRLDLTDGAIALASDLWWNPAESGAGLTITQHASNRPFVVWYTYDSAGAPVWRVMPGGTWSDRTLTGQLFETRGPAYFGGTFDPTRVTSQSIGSATLRFDDESNALFAYSLVGGAHGEKRITRQLFAAPVANPFPPLEDLADLYWNPAESGWGMVVNHQYNRVFATWYVYGDDGKPLWVVMPDAVVGPEFAGAIVRGRAAGDLFTTRGPAEGAPFDPARVVSTKVGTATLHLGGSEITLEYTAFGRSETRTLTRQPF